MTDHGLPPDPSAAASGSPLGHPSTDAEELLDRLLGGVRRRRYLERFGVNVVAVAVYLLTSDQSVSARAFGAALLTVAIHVQSTAIITLVASFTAVQVLRGQPVLPLAIVLFASQLGLRWRDKLDRQALRVSIICGRIAGRSVPLGQRVALHVMAVMGQLEQENTRAIIIKERSSDPWAVLSAQLRLAYQLASSLKPQSSLQLLDESEALLQTLDVHGVSDRHAQGVAMMRAARARLYTSFGAHQEALDEFQRAIAIATNITKSRHQRTALSHIEPSALLVRSKLGRANTIDFAAARRTLPPSELLAFVLAWVDAEKREDAERLKLYDNLLILLKVLNRNAWRWARMGDARPVVREIGAAGGLVVLTAAGERGLVRSRLGLPVDRLTRLATDSFKGDNGFLSLGFKSGDMRTALAGVAMTGDLVKLFPEMPQHQALSLRILAVAGTEHLRNVIPLVWLRRHLAQMSAPIYASLIRALFEAGDHEGVAIAIEAARGQHLHAEAVLSEWAAADEDPAIYGRTAALPGILTIQFVGRGLMRYIDALGLDASAFTPSHYFELAPASGGRDLLHWDDSVGLIWALMSEDHVAAGSVPLADLAVPLARLHKALPMRLVGEESFEVGPRCTFGLLAKPSEKERLLARQLGQVLLPRQLLDTVGGSIDAPARVRVAPCALTKRVPWSWLAIDRETDQRLIERFEVELLPPLGIRHGVALDKSALPHGRRLVSAVIDPDEAMPLRYGRTLLADERLHSAREGALLQGINGWTVPGDRPASFRRALELLFDGGIFLFVGHGGVSDEKLGSGISLGDGAGVFASDVLAWFGESTLAGTVFLLACDTANADSFEWNSLASALIQSGCTHVVVTVCPVLEAPATVEFDARLIAAALHSESASKALRQVQLEFLLASRTADGATSPLTWALHQVMAAE